MTQQARIDAPQLEIRIEIPRGSFLKRGSRGKVDFISPFPCPYNYGSVAAFIGGEGDLLDAVVLGPRLPAGTCITLPAWGAVGLAERFMCDDKMICAASPPSTGQRRRLLRFFSFYALCKGQLNRFRGLRGASHCQGWSSACEALERAQPNDGSWQGADVSW
jgi:inorganic pyrophosphatase